MVNTEHLAGMFGLSLPFSVCKVNLKYVECTKLYCSVLFFSVEVGRHQQQQYR